MNQLKSRFISMCSYDPNLCVFIACFALLINIGGVVMCSLSYSGGELVLRLGLGILIYTLIVWSRPVATKPRSEGHYTRFVQTGLRYAMVFVFLSGLLFILLLSWAFFHSSLTSTVEIGAIWPPKGIEVLSPWEIPFFKTLMFFFPGIGVACGLHAILAGNKQHGIYLFTAMFVLTTLYNKWENLEADLFSFVLCLFRSLCFFAFPFIISRLPGFTTCLAGGKFLPNASGFRAEQEEDENNPFANLDDVAQPTTDEQSESIGNSEPETSNDASTPVSLNETDSESKVSVPSSWDSTMQWSKNEKGDHLQQVLPSADALNNDIMVGMARIGEQSGLEMGASIFRSINDQVHYIVTHARQIRARLEQARANGDQTQIDEWLQHQVDLHRFVLNIVRHHENGPEIAQRVAQIPDIALFLVPLRGEEITLPIEAYTTLSSQPLDLGGAGLQHIPADYAADAAGGAARGIAEQTAELVIVANFGAAAAIAAFLLNNLCIRVLDRILGQREIISRRCIENLSSLPPRGLASQRHQINGLHELLRLLQREERARAREARRPARQLRSEEEMRLENLRPLSMRTVPEPDIVGSSVQPFQLPERLASQLRQINGLHDFLRQQLQHEERVRAREALRAARQLQFEEEIRALYARQAQKTARQLRLENERFEEKLRALQAQRPARQLQHEERVQARDPQRAARRRQYFTVMTLLTLLFIIQMNEIINIGRFSL